MNANKVIHEAMGLCWHILGRLKNDKSGRYVSCDKCEKRIKVGVWSIASDNPDYTAPVQYCALMAWMRVEVGLLERQRLLIFIEYRELKGMEAVHFFGLPVGEQVNLIAEAIEAGALK